MFKGFELNESLVSFANAPVDWQAAIRIATGALVEQGYVKKDYVEGMIDSVNEHGPYIVIAPNIALPHARPELGALKVGYSVTRFERPIAFEKDGSCDATLFISLSCTENDMHVLMLQEIVTILSDEEKCQRLLTTNSKAEIVELFNA